jgi:Sortase and related acyltransferases
MDITFTLAALADLDALVDSMRDYYAFDHLAFDGRVARTALQQIVSEPLLGRVYLIQSDGQTLGYVVLTLGFSLEFRGRDAFVDELYLRPSVRGQGIGKRTLQHAETVCRSLGVQVLHLEVKRANVKAQEIYKKFGFQDHDRYLMTKWLTL